MKKLKKYDKYLKEEHKPLKRTFEKQVLKDKKGNPILKDGKE